MKSILKMAVEGFMVHALLPLFPGGVLSTRVNPDTFRIRVDGQIRFDYATCGWKYFFNPGRKSFGLKNIRIRVETTPQNNDID